MNTIFPILERLYLKKIKIVKIRKLSFHSFQTLRNNMDEKIEMALSEERRGVCLSLAKTGPKIGNVSGRIVRQCMEICVAFCRIQVQIRPQKEFSCGFE